MGKVILCKSTERDKYSNKNGKKILLIKLGGKRKIVT